ncbi:hypothetical protein M2459_003468 [Parabacteroides sp. PF5-5]|uniref:hypothetical protein n=1 Tax=unclassified Parabacteroides TaxID=2649774 RepID=UPI0024739D4E|nr:MULTISPECIES: hypothetical protein [unclassified Parabacteroides]MDH6306905.1 hypothetical protein [Parabacteroides sp. PH5-39]MDH6317707.1 hypothetical protein [Parabacteroides sp. PF5-13]MDH6321706.1 hypothetical protein [Parabacteroides sp. PH5-13]MDH6325292.1 hypothetical protein [Parabacteroides sp. PH5-8]MDH6328892.1 hypothetical protein [Parabacteroides sp. PH5-41]
MKAIKYIFLLLLPALPVAAQNTMTSSPYSMFGLGEMVSGLYGQNAAMGGVAYGMRQPMLINVENPAGLTGMDSCRLIAEVSAFLKSENYQSRGKSNNAFTGNVSAFMMGGRIIPRWYMAASLTPYSTVGYYFKSSQPLEGTASSTIESTFEGDGGLSKASVSNAFLLPWNLSLGVNISYIFGTMTQKETQDNMSLKQYMDARAFYADFGLQYQRALNKHTRVTLGAVYGYEQKIKLENKQTITSSLSETETTNRKITQYLPQFAGLGGSLQYKHMTYGLDYTFRKYSALKSGASRVVFKDAHELRSGLCYSPQGYGIKNYWKRMSYKAGFNLSTPYYNINGKGGLGWRATLGLGFPVSNGQISASFFYDKLQLKGNTLQKDVIGLTVSYTLSENFYKVKL